jgi:hypothetical protein
MAYIRLLHISDLHFSFEPRRLDALSRICLGFREFQVLRALFRLRYNGLFSSHDRDLARAIAEFADLNSSLLDGIIIMQRSWVAPGEQTLMIYFRNTGRVGLEFRLPL